MNRCGQGADSTAFIFDPEKGLIFFVPRSAFKMVGSGSNALLVVFPDLFRDGRFTVGCGEHRPELIWLPWLDLRQRDLGQSQACCCYITRQ